MDLSYNFYWLIYILCNATGMFNPFQPSKMKSIIMMKYKINLAISLLLFLFLQVFGHHLNSEVFNIGKDLWFNCTVEFWVHLHNVIFSMDAW